ncbi:RING finger protein 212B-like [Rhincodon typus]|uniref:RING finger protein 212B-like n=1 Tax=Rhincodon typus TaxID=259920 RepID=UPI00202EFEFE|nr:RING finger protein 212B-like [Rhincodon typus]
MDWIHCNKCYLKPSSNIRFSISNCKHIVCHKCIEQDKCSVCGMACKHLALTDNIADHEKMYFKKPSEICRKYLEHIAQVTRFQRKQTELLLSFYKHKISKMEAALQEAQCKIRLQEKETAALKGQVDNMKKLLSVAKIPPHDLQLRRSNNTRPIAITSPSSRVTPKQTPQSIGSYSGNTASSSRPESVGQMSGNSVSRSGGLLTPRGSSIASGRSTPRDAIMGSPSAESGDSLSHRLWRGERFAKMVCSRGEKHSRVSLGRQQFQQTREVQRTCSQTSLSGEKTIIKRARVQAEIDGAQKWNSSQGLASRTPTLLTVPVSGGQDSSEGYNLRDGGLPPSHRTRHVPLAAYVNPLTLVGLSDSHRAPSVNSEPRRPIQDVTHGVLQPSVLEPQHFTTNVNDLAKRNKGTSSQVCR